MTNDTAIRDFGHELSVIITLLLPFKLIPALKLGHHLLVNGR